MIVTQDYGWSQIVQAQGGHWPQDTGWAMAQAVQAGFDGWEPFLQTAEDARRIGGLAATAGLALPSVFVSGRLAGAGDDRAQMAAAALAAKAFGARLVAVYPSALGRDKTDTELDQQAANLTALALQLGAQGMRVLYHPEEPEMRDTAREFHHVMAQTPDQVGLCLDPDTVWRGCGRTMEAVLEVVVRHGPRIQALHIRQSQGGIWDEVVGPGDLDYPLLAKALAAIGCHPLLVVEHAYEPATPRRLDPVAAHRQSRDFVRATFGAGQMPG
jgi:inosose dehydratase